MAAKLKPQDFSGLVDKDITVATAPMKMIEAISKRKDLSIGLQNYLIKLVEYSSKGTPAAATELKRFYAKVAAEDRNAVQKDFSELLAPIILLKESKANAATLKKLKLTMSATSKMFIPAAGNYPLIDFMVKTGTVTDEYSVKTMQKTTNTLKAADVLKAVSKQVLDRYAAETAILKLIDKNDAKLGPILALAKIAPTMPEFSKTHKMYKKFTTATTFTNDVFAANPVDWYDFFEPVMNAYYANGKATLNKAWKAKFYYDAITVLAQYTVADVTSDMNWMPFVDDVQKKVTYFKFGLTTNGTYEFMLVNGASERKPGQKFRLRAKSRLKEGEWSKRSGQDKLGIQP